MIEHHWLQNHTVLEIVPRWPLTSVDFDSLAAQIDPVITEHGSLSGLLINAEDFAGWENFSALVSHFVFVRNHQRHIHKIAVVSDQPLLGFMPRLVDHFIRAEVRPFAASDKGKALDWLTQPG